MKKYSALSLAIIFITAFVSFNSFAQSKFAYVYKDDFTANKHNWPTGNSVKYNLQIAKDKATLVYTQKKGFFIAKESHINVGRNFQITLIVKTISENEGGLVWGMSDASNLQLFLLKGTKFRIAKSKGGIFTNDVDYKESTAIKKNQMNKLLIERKDSHITYSINGQEVYSTLYFPTAGTQIGLANWEAGQIEVDELSAKEDAKNINVDPELFFAETPVALTGEINTKGIELQPIISPDGKTLYYIARDYSNNVGGVGDDDIYMASIRDSVGRWNKGHSVGVPLNNDAPNNVFSVSHDGQTLLLGNIYNETSSEGGGVSITRKTSRGGWMHPIPQTIEHYYNKSKFGEFCLAGNEENILIMTVKRKDGIGGNDLFVSFKTEDDNWSEPKNMGSIINTTGNEFTPYLAADNTTLYYSSDGLPGYGSADVFMTKRLDESWTKWSQPKNLGPNINTEEFEAYYTLPASGNYAYFVKTNGDNNEDIFRVELPSSIRPDPVALISGRVLDAKTKKPLKAKIQYEDLAKHKSIGIASSDSLTGKYQIILSKGRDYGYSAKAKGYISVSEHIDLSSITAYEEIKRDLYLVPIEAGQTINLNNVFFYQSKAELLPSSTGELNRLAEIMNDNSTMVIQIEGHTDNQGDSHLNLLLSESRVKAVSKYLISQGIAEKRITGIGYGDTKPVAPNDTETNRAKNRRVAFKIIKR